MTDRELVVLFQQGDPFQEGAPAFEELMRRYRRLVWSRAYRLVSGYYPDPAGTASDLEDETFVKVYQKLRTLKSPDSFKYWLCRITTNTCFDRLHHDRLQQLMVQSLDELIENGRSFELGRAGDAEEDVLVGELMKLLTPVERVMLIMRFVEGRTLNEIADELEIAGEGRHVTVSRILNRCLHKLRRLLRGTKS